MLFGAAGAAGLAGLGTALYRQAPSFWRQYAAEMAREIDPAPHRPSPRVWPDKGVHGAWLGHATILMKIDGMTVITDPVLSDRVGLSLGLITLGLKRLTAPALERDALPPIDLILLSHAHFDHFDIPTLRRLESRKTTVVTAYRTSDLLRPSRYRQVHELRWGERVRVGPLTVRAIEVNHWGARMRSDTYRGYNGYVIESDRSRILFGGDTAQTSALRTARSSRAVDLAIMPIGAYNPWIRYHCTPEQAWTMGNQAGAERFVPLHHQTFALSREPFYEPIERFHDAAGASSERILVSRVGQEFRV